MNKEQFLKLLENAKTDKEGNLYVLENDYRKTMNMDTSFYDEDELERKHYFGFIYTVCADLIEEYCSKDGDGYELYDRHFTGNDDTLECKIVHINDEVKDI